MWGIGIERVPDLLKTIHNSHGMARNAFFSKNGIFVVQEMSVEIPDYQMGD
jgi:hypothetical protein